jgi:hypothetical protein
VVFYFDYWYIPEKNMTMKAFYNKKEKRSTYERSIRNSDVRPDAQITEGNNQSAYGQNLAAKKGIEAAGRLLYR